MTKEEKKIHKIDGHKLRIFLDIMRNGTIYPTLYQSQQITLNELIEIYGTNRDPF